MSTDQVKARLRPFGISFEKSLTDLIKGIRSNNSDPDRLSNFLTDSIQECRNELKTTDLELKSMAVLKLAYLEMYGFDMSWCSFHVLEVMSSSKFQHKRIGYLAAIQILQRQNNDDALMLMTNLLKKDINSSNFVETGMAISGVAAIVTNDLAQDICDDMVKMLNHSKPFIRKKAVLAMYKIFLKFPEALRSNFSRLIEKLEDDDNSVVSATVNVICELAHKNPKNYVDLAPRLFGLLKDTNNNWMVIRLLKLLSSLSLTEPRLKYILLPEIIELMEHTRALSIVYEAINCILNGQMLTTEDTKIAKLIINKLIGFLQNEDQDLKYVGLLAFIKTCKIHKDLIKKHDKIILASIYDDDLTIREKSLEIIDSLVTEKNIVLIVTRLLIQLVPIDEQSSKLHNLNERDELSPSNDSSLDFIRKKQEPITVTDKYKSQVIFKIIEICSQSNYENIPNFKWYLGVLKDIINLNKDNKLTNIDKFISEQFVDLAIRVPSIRGSLVGICIELVVNVDESELISFNQGLKNCIWVIGEYYNDYITSSYDNSDSESEDEDDEDNDGDRTKTTGAQIINKVTKQTFLQKTLSQNLSDETIPIYIHSLSKLFSKYINSLDYNWQVNDLRHVIEVIRTLINWLDSFATCLNFEVQERSLSFVEILKLGLDALNTDLETLESLPDENGKHAPSFLTTGFSQLFNTYQIKPISSTIQYQIPVPVDLDLESPINEGSMVEFTRLLNKIEEGDKTYEVDDEENDDDDHLFEPEVETDQFSESDEDNELILSGEQKSAMKKKKERLDRLRDDPFYLSLEASSTTGSTKHNNLTNDDELASSTTTSKDEKKVKKERKKPKKIRKERVLILGDEEPASATTLTEPPAAITAVKKGKASNKNKLVIDSSSLDNFDLLAIDDNDGNNSAGKSGYDEYDVEKLRKQFESVGDSSVDAAAVAAAVEQVKKVKKPKKKTKKDAKSENTPATTTTHGSDRDVVVTVKKKPKKKIAVIRD